MTDCSLQPSRFRVVIPLVASSRRVSSQRPSAASRYDTAWLGRSLLLWLIVWQAVMQGRARQPGRSERWWRGEAQTEERASSWSAWGWGRRCVDKGVRSALLLGFVHSAGHPERSPAASWLQRNGAGRAGRCVPRLWGGGGGTGIWLCLVLGINTG